MAKKDYFIVPGTCARERLKKGGVREEDMEDVLNHTGETYIGLWVTRACAQKVCGNCLRHNKMKDLTRLFYNDCGYIVEIKPDNIPAHLGFQTPRNNYPTPDKPSREIRLASPAVA